MYDYPQIAPESPDTLFDSTEIDEILSLRILTLTDEEKRAMAAVDERARRLLERIEAMSRDQLVAMHGLARTLRAWRQNVGDCPDFSVGHHRRGRGEKWDCPLLPRRFVSRLLKDWEILFMYDDDFGDFGAKPNLEIHSGGFRPGMKVRLSPAGSADAFDIILRGKIATINSLEQDFEGQIYAAVTVDDDPGRDFGQQLQPGHRFFFRLDEVEPLDDAAENPR